LSDWFVFSLNLTILSLFGIPIQLYGKRGCTPFSMKPQFLFEHCYEARIEEEKVKQSHLTQIITPSSPDAHNPAFAFTIKVLKTVKIIAYPKDKVNIYYAKEKFTRSELRKLSKALFSVGFFEYNFKLRKIVVLRTLLEKRFYSTPEGQHVRSIPKLLKKWAEEDRTI